MDINKQVMLVDTIRETLETYVGETLDVRANMGRSKIVECEGTLTQVHPRLFILEVQRKRGRVARQSYQFVDILTGTVELSRDGKNLFKNLIEEEEEEGAE